MEKTIIIDGKAVAFKSSGAVPKRYKMQFQRDFLNDLLSLGVAVTDYSKLSDKEKLEAIRKLNFDIFYDMVWTLAKTADPSIQDPLTWLDSFETFPIVDILPEIQDLLTASISTKKK